MLYIYAVLGVALFIMAFLWFIFYACFDPVKTAIVNQMSQYDVNGSAYPSFELADQFMSNLWVFFLVILVFGLLYWAFIYSQRKGYPVVYAE